MRKLLVRSFVAAALVALGATPALAADPQVLQVSGTFQSHSETCQNGNPDCVTDALQGDLVGTDQLTTVSFTESPTVITFHDQSELTTQYGTFFGDERGVIFLADGHFQSTGVYATADGCGHLVLHINGQIDLVTEQDSGTYTGTLVLVC